MLSADEYEKAEFDLAVAETRRGFWIHAIVYATVMTGLVVLNVLLMAYTDGDFPWVVFPLVGWGIGLTFHYIDAFRREGRAIQARQHEIERYAERHRVGV